MIKKNSFLVLAVCILTAFCFVKLNAAPAELFGTSLIADIAEKASPAVVAIESIHYVRTVSGSGDPFFDKFFGHLFSENFNGFNNVIPQKGNGSGVIISPQGHLLTNDHVIEGADEVYVKLHDGKRVKAKLIGKDVKTDLAVLKIDTDKSLPYLNMGDSDALRVGEWVVAIGNPFGLGITVTAGVVSALNRDLSVDQTHSYKSLIQTDASINPGNSGGALLNPKGELIGINTAIIPYGQGIGFAIPINPAKKVVGDLIAFGRVKKPFLGVTVQKITPSLAAYFNIPDKGVLVTDVIKKSAAETAGLVPGDVILAIDGNKVTNLDEFRSSIIKHRVGEKVKIKVYRKGKVGMFEAVFNESPESKSILGVSVETVDQALINKYYLFVNKGVVITKVREDSPADRAGLRPGDVILQVNNVATLKKETFDKIVNNLSVNSQILLRVVRGNTVNMLMVFIN